MSFMQVLLAKNGHAVERETGGVTRQQEKTPFESEEYMPDYRGVSIAPAAQNISGTSNQRDA